jgi:uncharacterized repeat protein (TIGR03803 family)
MGAFRTNFLALVGVMLATSPALSAPKVKVIYDFKGGRDGADPNGTLVNVNGTLWGVTYNGGDTDACSPYGCGTVFKVSLAGAETVVHRFQSPRDGESPYAGLTRRGGDLYGTTMTGGPNAKGTLFKVTQGGRFALLHGFGAEGDGAHPYGTPIFVNGTFYGTTSLGGASNLGTVYQFAPTRVESVLYSFEGGTDTNTPIAGLVDVGGALYGAGQGGGAFGWGGIYKVTLAGAESLAYSFANVADGYDPIGGLTKIHGALYGTTFSGGACELGCGTVFKLDLNGTKTILHEFTPGGDGTLPQSNVLDVDGILYGTTETGGKNTCFRVKNGCGTIFRVARSGAEQVVHSFGAPGDGVYPEGGLTYVDGILYGTTYAGGANGAGTVFTITP